MGFKPPATRVTAPVSAHNRRDDDWPVLTLTPQQRSLRARQAAIAMHVAGRTNTGPATKAFLDRWERQVDPDGILAPDERARRARMALRAHMLRLAYRSSRARAIRRAGGKTTGKRV